MADNGYELYFKDKSDSVYVRPDRISLGVGDRLALTWTDIKLGLRRFRKRLSS